MQMAKQKPKRLGCFFQALIVFFLVSIAAGVFYCRFQKYFPNPSTRHISVRGRVVDAATGNPVGEARVVVTVLNESGLTYFEQYFYGLTTDDEGSFKLETTSPIDVDWLAIEICSNDGRVGSISIPTNVVDTKIEIEISPPQSKQSSRQYNHFSGQYVPWSQAEIEFVGAGWRMRTRNDQ